MDEGSAATLWPAILGAIGVASAVFFGPSLLRRFARGGEPRPSGGRRRSTGQVTGRAASASASGAHDRHEVRSSRTHDASRDRSTGDVLVALRGVTRVYPDADGVTVTALRGVDLDVHEGEMLGVIGPSGLGKSTLLHILGAIDFPTSGTLLWKGEALPAEESPSVREYRASGVCFVFQDLNLVTHLTAEENAALPLTCQGVERATALARARGQLEELGLGRLLHRRAHQLSGGQRQRVAIARAFTSRAPLLLADEPTGSLDPETAESVMDAFASRARSEGRTVVLVTHNPSLAHRYCDRVLVCSSNGLVDAGGAVEAKDPGAGTSEVPGSRGARPSSGARAHVARGRAR